GQTQQSSDQQQGGRRINSKKTARATTGARRGGRLSCARRWTFPRRKQSAPGSRTRSAARRRRWTNGRGTFCARRSGSCSGRSLG
ncbi:hypothetical protein pipiens_020377, partial [Culex pipiens pipiens]